LPNRPAFLLLSTLGLFSAKPHTTNHIWRTIAIIQPGKGPYNIHCVVLLLDDLRPEPGANIHYSSVL
jgi:hypothetical protein